jgi:hypothetical protein
MVSCRKSYDSPCFVYPWIISPKAQFNVNTFPQNNISLIHVSPESSFPRVTFPPNIIFEFHFPKISLPWVTFPRISFPRDTFPQVSFPRMPFSRVRFLRISFPLILQLWVGNLVFIALYRFVVLATKNHS